MNTRPSRWITVAGCLFGALCWPCAAQDDPQGSAQNGEEDPPPSPYEGKAFGAGLRIGSPYLLEAVGLFQPVPQFQVGLRGSGSLKLWTATVEVGGALVIRDNQRLHLRAGTGYISLWSRECTETLPSTCDPNGGWIVDGALGWSYFGDWLELRIDAGIVYLDWTLDGTQANDFEERELSPMFSLCAMKWW